jgi:CHAT domain-containing protein
LGYFEQPWNVFDEMIKLQAVSAAGLPAALMFAERFRARDLAETASGPAAASLVNPTALAARIPSDTAIIYYVRLEDRLLVWVLRSHRVVQQTLPTDALDTDITVYRTSLQDGRREEIDRTGVRLYDSLVRPLLPSLEGAATLAIIPDGILNEVPFAALKNHVTGKYLIEDYAIHMAPSATMFEKASERLHRTRLGDDATVLVFANPRVDPSDARGLPNLSRAEAEGRDLATIYQSASVLIGPHATKRAFLETAARHRIVHFAGHALANDQYPLLSRLMLARDRSDQSGSLFAHEILELKLDATGLVVLAGCRTGIGAIKKGEGVISLARPFLAVGVPSVIAALWDVDDATTRALFGAFYKTLRQGAEPVVALRVAQLQLLRERNETLHSPAAWAAFISLGGLRPNGGQ